MDYYDDGSSLNALTLLLGGALIFGLAIFGAWLSRLPPPRPFIPPPPPPPGFPGAPAPIAANVEQELVELQRTLSVLVYGDVRPLTSPAERRILGMIRNYEAQVAKFATEARKAAGL